MALSFFILPFTAVSLDYILVKWDIFFAVSLPQWLKKNHSFCDLLREKNLDIKAQLFEELG